MASQHPLGMLFSKHQKYLLHSAALSLSSILSVMAMIRDRKLNRQKPAMHAMDRSQDLILALVNASASLLSAANLDQLVGNFIVWGVALADKNRTTISVFGS